MTPLIQEINMELKTHHVIAAPRITKKLGGEFISTFSVRLVFSCKQIHSFVNSRHHVPPDIMPSIIWQRSYNVSVVAILDIILLHSLGRPQFKTVSVVAYSVCSDYKEAREDKTPVATSKFTIIFPSRNRLQLQCLTLILQILVKLSLVIFLVRNHIYLYVRLSIKLNR